MNRQITLKITGMHCGGCSANVEKALKNLEGVSKVTVNLTEGKAVVDYDPDKTDDKTMVRAVKNAGFSAG